MSLDVNQRAIALENVLNPVVSHTEGFSGVKVIATNNILTVVFMDADKQHVYGIYLGKIKSTFLATVIARLVRATEHYQEAMLQNKELEPVGKKFGILIYELDRLAEELSTQESNFPNHNTHC